MIETLWVDVHRCRHILEAARRGDFSLLILWRSRRRDLDIIDGRHEGMGGLSGIFVVPAQFRVRIAVQPAWVHGTCRVHYPLADVRRNDVTENRPAAADPWDVQRIVESEQLDNGGLVSPDWHDLECSSALPLHTGLALFKFPVRAGGRRVTGIARYQFAENLVVGLERQERVGLEIVQRIGRRRDNKGGRFASVGAGGDLDGRIGIAHLADLVGGKLAANTNRVAVGVDVHRVVVEDGPEHSVDMW